MFTGIVEEIGEIVDVKKGSQSAQLTIRGDVVTNNSKIGDSIAVNGVCLTATTISNNIFTADVMAETMRRSSLGSLSKGSKVNLERAMAADGRFGGHIVSGHIDGTGTVKSLKKEDNAVWVTIEVDRKLIKYIIEKGSVAIDGISLTVAVVTDTTFSVSIIPHTAKETILLTKKENDIVNIENDIIGKYVDKLLNFNDINDEPNNSKINMDFLAKNGFV